MDEAENRSVRETLLSLCIRAEALKLSFEALDEIPIAAQRYEYYSMVRDDLVDAVEHVPGNLWGGIDREAWHSSDMRAALNLHISLLSSTLSTHEMMEAYRRAGYPK